MKGFRLLLFYKLMKRQKIIFNNQKKLYRSNGKSRISESIS